jgi:hypothetical protein
VRELAGLNISEVYSADYINEFYDDTRDVVVLAPVLAVQVSPQAPVSLGPELKECSWFDATAARARLPFAGQRWAVRHINELMGAGLAESQLYRLQLPDESLAPLHSVPSPKQTAPGDPDDEDYGDPDPFTDAPGGDDLQESFDRDVPDEVSNDELHRPYDRG